MDMDKRELRFMNSAFRRFFQRHYEFKIFKELLKRNDVQLTYKVILDAGCGSGYSTELLLREFEPKELVAFDIMPEQVALAKQRGLPSNIFLADVTNTKLPSVSFDAVFVFGVLHHVPEWRSALKEISRVLKHNGILLIEEPDKKALNDAERYLKVRHPKESRFEWPEFVEALEKSGFRVIENRKIYMGHLQSFACVKLN
jgi:ubiquinone/menaquinone biosynthesis C-methylase UbiE